MCTSFLFVCITEPNECCIFQICLELHKLLEVFVVFKYYSSKLLDRIKPFFDNVSVKIHQNFKKI